MITYTNLPAVGLPSPLNRGRRLIQLTNLQIQRLYAEKWGLAALKRMTA